MADAITGTIAEIRSQLVELTRQINALNVRTTEHEDAIPALRQRISDLEEKVAELER